jgi:peptide/nickel transport system substrate-binding protein
VGQIRKLNPLFSGTNPVDRDITSLIYEGLTTINQYGEVVPDLASGWVVGADGLDYIFALRKDVLWQDGIPFTSADVAYTFRTIRDSDFPGDPALRDFWRTVEIRVIDDYTIRFRLVQPLASFPEKLRQGIVPLHALDGAPIETLDQHPFNLSPIGTGAYQIESLFSEDGQISGISLRVAPNYRLRPEGGMGYAIDRIVFRTYPSHQAVVEAYQRGEINSLGSLPIAQIREYRDILNQGLASHTAIAPGVGVILYNWRRDDLAYLRDQRMRIALGRAVDRHQAVTKTMAGRAIPADSPILPTSWAYNPTALYPEPNLDEARRLLEQVSFEPYQPEATESADATPETPPPAVEQRRNLSLLVLDDPNLSALAQAVADGWEQLGLTVDVAAVDYASLVERLQSGDFDAALVEFSFEPDADPDQFTLWHFNQYQLGLNFGGLNDSYISNVLYEARINPSGLNRKQYYDDFQQAFTSRAPALVLYYPLFIYATDSRLQGIQLDFISTPADRFRTIQDWYFAAEG